MKSLTPELMVENVDTTVEYYRSILRFQLVQSVPKKSPLDWALMRRGTAEIMFESRTALATELPSYEDKPIASSIILYFKVDKIQELYEDLQYAVTISHGLHPTFYGTKEFAIEDLNGYTLVFSE